MEIGPTWCFFISHTSRDDEAAGKLYDALAIWHSPFQHSAYLDYRCSPNSERWREIVPKSQWKSRTTIALISKHTVHARYQASEIAAAVALSRGPQRHRLIPVYLTDEPADMRPEDGLSWNPNESINQVIAPLTRLAVRIQEEDPRAIDSAPAVRHLSDWLDSRPRVERENSPVVRALEAVKQESHWEAVDVEAIRLRLNNRLFNAGWTAPQLDLLGIGEHQGRFRLLRPVFQSGQEIQTIVGNCCRVCVPLSRGRLLLAGGNELRICDIDSGRELTRRTLARSEFHSVRACALSPDQAWIAIAAQRKTIEIRSIAPGFDLIATFVGHKSDVWDVATQNCVTECVVAKTSFGLPPPRIRSCDLSPDGRFVVGALADSGAVVFDVETGNEKFKLPTSRHVTCIRYDDRGERIVTADESGTLRIWSGPDGYLEHELTGHSGPTWSCVFSPCGDRVLSTGHDKTVRQWSSSSGKQLTKLVGHSEPVWCCCYLSEERAASGSSDGTIKIWRSDGNEHTVSSRRYRASDTVGSLRDGRPVACGQAMDDEHISIVLFDPLTEELIQSFEGLRDWSTACAISQDGARLAAYELGGTLFVWDTSTGRRIACLDVGYEGANNMTFGATGDLLINTSEEPSRFELWSQCIPDKLTWGYVSGALWQGALLRGGDGRTDIAYTSGTNYVMIATGMDGDVIGSLDGHSNTVNHCTVSPDGRFLATSSRDKTIRIWSSRTFRALVTLEGHTEAVNHCAFSPSSNQLVSASDDRTLRVWNVKKGRCIDSVYGFAPFRRAFFLKNMIIAEDMNDSRWILGKS